MQLGFVFVGDGAAGQTRLWKFNRHIEERATSIARPRDVGGEPLQMLAQLLPGTASIGRSHLVPMREKIPMFAFQKSGHEIVLGWKPAVQAGLGGAGFRYDGVDPDRANAIAVE